MRRLAILALGLSLTAGPALAQSASMADWVRPPVAPSKPQSDAEKELGKTQGRALPALEVLQPSLDLALPAYVPLKNRKALKGHYKAAASDVLPGQAKLWVKAFEAMYPNVHIEVTPPYAGSLGAKELVKQNLDFVFVSRELKPDDITDFRAKFGYDPLSVPIMGGTFRDFGFLDAVGFVVNRDNPIDQLSFQQLDAILSTTHARGGAAITTWGQLGLTGEWADKPIHVYAIKPWNGFEEFVRQRVLSSDGKRGEWRKDLNFSETVFPIAGSVARDRYALGYTGFAYVDAPVKVIALQAEAGGPVAAPTYEAVAGAQWPLARLVFFNTNKKPGKPLDPAVEEFLKFVLSRQGQALVLKEGVYLPLRGGQANAARAMLRP